MILEPGTPAPTFALVNQFGETVRLADLIGEKPVALVFFPLAFSRVCQGELCELRDNIGMFRDADVELVGISVDSKHTLRAWAEAESYDFPLLADFWPHGAVAQAYGCFNEERGCSTRGTYVIDKDGIVRWKVVNAIPDARDQTEYLKVLADL
jgi:mycoredoxin-dependent peroxiredoxin